SPRDARLVHHPGGHPAPGPGRGGHREDLRPGHRLRDGGRVPPRARLVQRPAADSLVRQELRRFRPRHAAAGPGLPRLLRAARRRDQRAHRALLLRAHLGAGLALARPRAAPARRLTTRGPVAPTLLKIEGLTKRFGDRVAVAGCSLTIAEGEIVVIIGPSGCGKTTFLRCINRLEAPTAGSVVLRDEPIGGQMRDGRWRPFTESE